MTKWQSCVVVMSLSLVGCGSEKAVPQPPPLLVQWVDKNGETWFAPPVLPEPDDPLFVDHPEPGIVMIDRATRQKIVVKDPAEVLKNQTSGPPRWIYVQKTASEPGK